MESLIWVAFMLGPASGLLVLPLTAGLLAFSSRRRSWLLALCFAIAAVAWIACFVLWGRGFTYANELQDTPESVVAAYDLSIITSAMANLVLIGLIGYGRRSRTERLSSSNSERPSTVIYGP